MFPTPAPVRRHWRRSQRTAEAVAPVRRFLPTHRIRDAVMSRRGRKWGVPAMLLAAPYIAAAKLLSDHIEQGGPGWLHLVVLLCAWNALKMLSLGPMSLIALAVARHREHVQRRTDRREAETHGAPDEALVMAGGAS
jgi:hypothetical protein